ncbi:MAG: hypothetical protein JSW40_02670 [Candidatus Omnitrophota bacterium]|nr:MAG: hypothetical protein JSW40_02670 [Candidatus Omnitrophota bacterium]
MKKRDRNWRFSQSMIEYICVCVVFATVGVITFIAAIRGAALARRGTLATYASPGTLMGKTLADGVAEGDHRLPSTWGDQMDQTDNFDGTVSPDQIANPEGETVGTPRGDFYDWSQWGGQSE